MFEEQPLASPGSAKQKLHIVSLHKVDGVGPLDNTPFADLLHRFMQKKERKQVTLEM